MLPLPLPFPFLSEPCIKGFEPQQLIKGMYAEFFFDWVPRFPAGAPLRFCLNACIPDSRI